MESYEYVREIFNSCSGNQMRDVDFTEIETDDLDAFMAKLLTKGDEITVKETLADGTVRYDVDSSGMHQRFSFTKI